MQLPWMKSLQIGDVITNGGRWRVVREVTRYNNGDLRSVTLAIRSCSWTGRCYTILNYTDLRCLGYRKVNVAPRKLRGRLDRKIHAAIHQPCHKPYILTCCDVESAA